jgi:hypothetical protein
MAIPRILIDGLLVLALIIAGVGILHIAKGTREIQQSLYDRQSRWSVTVDRLCPYMTRNDEVIVNILKTQGEILELVRALPSSTCHQGK